MRKSITVNIPEPCHEDWNKMTPREQGRHCAACNKTVIDFTIKTDEQIIETLESKGDICGRFKNQQLDREIVLARKDKNNYISWAASGLFAFLALGSNDAQAQSAAPQTIPISQIPRPQVQGRIATSILKEKMISGIVTTNDGNLPLSGVTVLIKGTTKGVLTNDEGKYAIKVKKGQTLVFSVLGYEKFELEIGKEKTTNIILKSNATIEDPELSIAGGLRVQYNTPNIKKN